MCNIISILAGNTDAMTFILLNKALTNAIASTFNFIRIAGANDIIHIIHTLFDSVQLYSYNLT